MKRGFPDTIPMDLLRCLFCLFLSRVGDCQFVRWIRNTDLNNPANWDRGNLPCGNDRMIIPDDSPVVYMQINTTIQELVVPMSGEIIFGSWAGLGFTNNPDHSAACLDSGSDITFNASHPAQWVDPTNWCPVATEIGPCEPRPLLDTERVPCAMDHVIFPTGSSYYVDLGSNLDIQVNTIKVSGKAYSSSTFRDFLSTENGRNIFTQPNSGPRSTVTINRRRCTDQTGCICGNDKGMLYTTLCSIQKNRCARPACTMPFIPVGHCCPVCGGMLNLTYGTGFNFNTLKTSIQRNFLDNKVEYQSVQYIVSKRSDGKVQMVLMDRDGVTSSKVATNIMADITADIRGGGMKYALVSASLQTSTAGSHHGPWSPSAHTGGQPSMSRGSVAGITIGCLIGLLLLAGAGFLFHRHTKTSEGSGFSARMFDTFNRFTASSRGNTQEPMPPSVGFRWDSHDSGLASIGGGSSQGFENPTYGITPMQHVKSMEMEVRSDVMTENQPIDYGFDNPLYDSVHQESLFTDPATVENPQLPTVMTLGDQGQDKVTSDTEA
ncbi:protein amnionless-like [Mya arenaria]|uniref:protein amnionless-like n=1 Tax=Mya arenaria TaxID=6604 RepID=UPI0022E30E97|nr:protein amnionless-like [Mya arenaria]